MFILNHDPDLVSDPLDNKAGNIRILQINTVDAAAADPRRPLNLYGAQGDIPVAHGSDTDRHSKAVDESMLALLMLDCGFCPVMRHPSCSTWWDHMGAATNVAPSSRQRSSSKNGFSVSNPAARSSSLVHPVTACPCVVATATCPKRDLAGLSHGRPQRRCDQSLRPAVVRQKLVADVPSIPILGHADGGRRCLKTSGPHTLNRTFPSCDEK